MQQDSNATEGEGSGRGLTGAGMTKPEKRFTVRYRLLDATAAMSRLGVRATHMTP